MSLRARFVTSGVMVCALVLLVFITGSRAEQPAGASSEGSALGLITSVPRTMAYQANLTDVNGENVPQGDYNITFRVYDEEVGGTLLWDETVTVTVNNKGIFTAVLGETEPLNLSFDVDYYLSLQVEGDDEMEPRQKLHMSPYAAVADTSEHALTLADNAVTSPTIQDASIQFSDIGQNGAVGGQVMKWNGSAWAADNDEVGAGGGGWADDGTVVRLETNSDSVGIGTTTPNEQLEITGNLRLPNTTATAGIIKKGPLKFIHNYGEGNTFVGVDAGNLTMTGFFNTGNGEGALYSNTIGSFNTANGYQALYSNSGGQANAANGYRALYSNTTGFYNTANGYGALGSNTEGYSNTAYGFEALFTNTTGFENTANGYGALFSNTEGFYNTANGREALYSNTTGNVNTAHGIQALYSNTTGTYNTAHGAGALYANITGSFNTALGTLANVSWGALTNATAIGYDAVVDASNKVRIGNLSVTSIGGQVGWTTFSDGRYKKSVSNDVPGLAFISRLKPVTYTVDIEAVEEALRPAHQPLEREREALATGAEQVASRQVASQIVYTGFVAQEVEEAARELDFAFSGVDAPLSENGMYGLRYAEFVAPLVKAVQEQQKAIGELNDRNEMLETRLAELEALVKSLATNLSGSNQFNLYENGASVTK